MHLCILVARSKIEQADTDTDINMPFSFSSLSHPHPRPAALPQRLSRTTPLLFLFLLIRHTTAQYHHPHRNVHGDGEGDPPRSLYLISHTDFCLFGPPSPLPSNTSSISQINRDVVSWCTDRRHGNRVVPEGTLNGVTYVKTNRFALQKAQGGFYKDQYSGRRPRCPVR